MYEMYLIISILATCDNTQPAIYKRDPMAMREGVNHVGDIDQCGQIIIIIIFSYMNYEKAGGLHEFKEREKQRGREREGGTSTQLEATPCHNHKVAGLSHVPIMIKNLFYHSKTNITNNDKKRIQCCRFKSCYQ